MRRTARALSTAVLASAALGFGAAPAPAEPGVPPPSAEPGVPPPSAGVGEPAAEVSPADVTPGGTVTVSVSCAPTGGVAPATLDATSAAFDEGTVELRKVGGGDGTTSGPAYRGTARIVPAEEFETAPDAAGSEDAWTVDGACPEASGGEGAPWSATMTVPGANGAGANGVGAKPPCPEPAAPGEPCGATEPACPDPEARHGETSAKGKPCGGATAQHGVRAGTGGAFTDSMPALVAGGALIAGAFGAAAHRLRLRLREDAEHR
ncbi:hypothetical protein [Streptomyces sp. NPDC017890]|uniref:hypothetical protein n=1 Tax=Streptomyces sp. NPDC017890 TaxID=3365015 RepID=UPI00379882DA